jgi:hypothetical protein
LVLVGVNGGELLFQLGDAVANLSAVELER